MNGADGTTTAPPTPPPERGSRPSGGGGAPPSGGGAPPPRSPARPSRPFGAAATEAATNRTLTALKEACRQAPTSVNTQPQVLVIVRDPVRRHEIVRRAARDRAAGALHWPMPWFAEATALVVVLYDTRRREPGVHGDRTALLGMGTVLESARIAAAATGSAWTEWRPSEAAEADLRSMLGFPPELQCHVVAGVVPEKAGFPPPPSLATPFAERYGHADPLLRVGSHAPVSGDPLKTLFARRTARSHFVSAPLPAETLRTLVAGAARAGRAPGIGAPRMVFVQSPTEIGKLADVMLEVAAALYKDADYSRAISQWQFLEEEEWRAKGDGLLAVGKGAPKLLRTPAKSLFGRLASAIGGSPVDEMVKESMSELVREAPLVVAWVVAAEDRSIGRDRTGESRRLWASAVLDAGASTMRLLYDAERLGLASQGLPILLEDLPGASSRVAHGEQRVKDLLSVPAECEVVNLARVGKPDPDDEPPPLAWRGDIRRPVEQMFHEDRFKG